jgi:quinol monooxygenase YgiN
VEDHGSLLLVENWETQQAMNEHIRSQDFRVILAVLDLSDSKPEIRFNSVISSQGLEYLRDVLAGD